MKKTNLTPINLRILQSIVKSKTTEVALLAEKLNMDRGRLEGGIATLVENKLIDRVVKTTVFHNLTKRGIEASNGLVERKIINILIKSPINMKDLNTMEGFSKGDVPAGIGILRKSGIIKINKGLVEIIDRKIASKFSLDVQSALSDLAGIKDSVDNKIADLLLARGFIEIEEKNVTTISTSITEEDLKSIKSVDEVSKLTPKLISSGEWQNVSFKPYSLNTKPRTIYPGKYNPYKQFLDHLRVKLIGLGFQEMRGPLVEQEFWNFDALYAPQDHASREDSDILLIDSPTHGVLSKDKYVKNVAKTHEDGWKTGSLGHRYKWDPKKAARLLLRPQGTAISARTLAKIEKPPAKFFSIARCFRPDQIDATHDVEFDQTEGIICDPSITFRDLLGMLRTFAIEVAGATEVRFRPDYYPFTSPSVELSAKHPVLGYIEFGGAGVFRPEVTQPFGIDYPVLAWGLGVGRLFMTKYNVKDIRELFTQNLGWLRDQEVSSGIQLEE
ncbi:MAG: phenylalanine--tRNA ligase subunit alpha [Candidatus Heimdallarchaeota archaeon]|nr:phenylalanine--tRNA ligase subunit alpha [Candidatus Heimdallarchaeota archaeon]